MTIVDDRTASLNLPKPNAANLLQDDVDRLRSALDAIDAAIVARQLALGFTPENAANKGVANGYASLDGSGKVPAIQLPSFVDDVLEYANQAAFPGTGEAGKIYVAVDTGKVFRWSGSAYVEISPSPGSTDSLVEGAVNLYFTAARALAAIPTASQTVAGLVKVGPTLTIAGGVLDVAGGTLSFEDIKLTVSSNGQTSFTVTGGYTPGAIQLHLNGIELVGGDDYTASNGTTVVLTAGALTTDTLILRRWSVFTVANAYTKAEVDARTMAQPVPVTVTSQSFSSNTPYVFLNSNMTTGTMPPSPSPGDRVEVFVANGRKDNVVSGLFFGTTQDIALDLGLPSYTFKFLDSTRGWYL